MGYHQPVDSLRKTDGVIRTFINTRTALGAGIFVNDGLAIIQGNGLKRTNINTNAAPCTLLGVYFRCHDPNLPVLTVLFDLASAAFAGLGLRPVG